MTYDTVTVAGLPSGFQIEELCQVTDCDKAAQFVRRFGWQISGATFLTINLGLCPQHTLAVDLLKGKTLPVTAILL